MPSPLRVPGKIIVEKLIDGRLSVSFIPDYEPSLKLKITEDVLAVGDCLSIKASVPVEITSS